MTAHFVILSLCKRRKIHKEVLNLWILRFLTKAQYDKDFKA